MYAIEYRKFGLAAFVSTTRGAGMAQDLMQYGQMVEDSLRGVVRMALIRAATDGLLGEHHFYIGFKTQYPGVDIPRHLEAQYPEEMTIVVQHKFWGLEVGDDAFEITLSFGGQGQRLHIPFQALTSFLDPSVQFGLQFGEAGAGSQGDGSVVATSETVLETDPEGTKDTALEKAPGGSADVLDSGQAPDQDSDLGEKSGDNVITLDQFRKD